MKNNISQEVDGVNSRQFLQLSANIGVLMAVMPDSAFAQGSKDLVVAIPADLGGWDPKVRSRGIEPRPPAWKAGILATELRTLVMRAFDGSRTRDLSLTKRVL